MIEIIIWNRGGQGGVTAMEILCECLLDEGVESQGIPQFGAERAGSPVMLSMRIKDKKEEHLPTCEIKQPDCLVVFDYSLTKQGENLLGLKKNGFLIINSNKNPLHFKNLGTYRVATIDAVNIANELKIGDEISPKINTAMLGAIARVLGFDLELLRQRIKKRFGKYADKNTEAAKFGYEEVQQNE